MMLFSAVIIKLIYTGMPSLLNMRYIYFLKRDLLSDVVKCIKAIFIFPGIKELYRMF